MARCTSHLYILLSCLGMSMSTLHAKSDKDTRDLFFVYDAPIYHEQRVYDLIRATEDALDDIVDFMPPFASLFPAYYTTPLRTIDEQWMLIADHWHDFLLAYMREHFVALYDMREIHAMLYEIRRTMHTCDPDTWNDFRYDFSAISYALDTIIALMGRPWYGWSSTTVSSILHQFEQISIILDGMNR